MLSMMCVEVNKTRCCRKKLTFITHTHTPTYVSLNDARMTGHA